MMKRGILKRSVGTNGLPFGCLTPCILSPLMARGKSKPICLNNTTISFRITMASHRLPLRNNMGLQITKVAFLISEIPTPTSSNLLTVIIIIFASLMRSIFLTPLHAPLTKIRLIAPIFLCFYSRSAPLPEDIQTLQSSHYEDYPELDPYQWPAHDKIQRPFYYPIANPRTSNAHITEITPPLSGSDVSISNVQYIAIGMPGFSIYFPFYFGLSHVPAALATGNNKADDISLFWQFRKVQTLVFLSDPDHAIPYDFKERQALVAARYDTLNAHIADIRHCGTNLRPHA